MPSISLQHPGVDLSVWYSLRWPDTECVACLIIYFPLQSPQRAKRTVTPATNPRLPGSVKEHVRENLLCRRSSFSASCSASGHAGHACRNFELLVIGGVVVIVLGLGDALYALTVSRVNIAHSARCILCLGSACAYAVPRIAAITASYCHDLRAALIVALVEQHDYVVRDLEADSGIMAEFTQERYVAGFEPVPHARSTDHRLRGTYTSFRLRCTSDSLCQKDSRPPKRGFSLSAEWRPKMEEPWPLWSQCLAAPQRLQSQVQTTRTAKQRHRRRHSSCGWQLRRQSSSETPQLPL